MNDRYQRNRIYITNEEQEVIKNSPILIGGSGIGSVIAECMLRLGFEHLTIIDGDQVELSNLNRQNYTENDIFRNKTTAIKSRLQNINKNAVINIHNCFITKNNIEGLIKGHFVAINALDFSTDIPLIFDKVSNRHNIPVLHPYNLGWGGLVAVIHPEGMSLSSIKNSNEEFNELDVVEYISRYLKFRRKPQIWIDEVLKKYKEEKEYLPPPQLSIGSWIVASMCAHIAYRIVVGKKVKKFPEFYFSTLDNS